MIEFFDHIEVDPEALMAMKESIFELLIDQFGRPVRIVVDSICAEDLRFAAHFCQIQDLIDRYQDRFCALFQDER